MSVVLEASLGDDLAIVNAARVSYAKRSEYEWVQGECPNPNGACNGSHITGVLKPADAGLINYLMREHHGTPFEMVQFRFRVRVPIGVGREWMRHRMGSFNEQSTRYVEMEPDFYVPLFPDVRVQVGKPGHYTMEPASLLVREKCVEEMNIAYAAAYESYRKLLTMGVAKELARNVLPLGLMTEFIWSVNLRSLLNFLALRTAPSALLEIRQEANAIELLANDVAPVAMDCWRQHGRVAP